MNTRWDEIATRSARLCNCGTFAQAAIHDQVLDALEAADAVGEQRGIKMTEPKLHESEVERLRAADESGYARGIEAAAKMADKLADDCERGFMASDHSDTTCHAGRMIRTLLTVRVTV